MVFQLLIPLVIKWITFIILYILFVICDYFFQVQQMKSVLLYGSNKSGIHSLKMALEFTIYS